MRGSAAARRYARALFQLASEEGAVERTREELDAMAALLAESSELRHALFRPLHPVAERRAVLENVAEPLGTSRTLQHFYSYLVDQRRLVDFDAIREEFRRLADEAAGRTHAEVVSASPLRSEQLDRLRDALTRRTGQQVQIRARVDPALLGGVVAKVGGLTFDGSLRTQLAQLRSNLTKG